MANSYRRMRILLHNIPDPLIKTDGFHYNFLSARLVHVLYGLRVTARCHRKPGSFETCLKKYWYTLTDGLDWWINGLHIETDYLDTCTNNLDRQTDWLVAMAECRSTQVDSLESESDCLTPKQALCLACQ